MEDQFDYDAPDVNPFGKAFSSDITGDGPRTKLVVLGVACVAVPFAMVGIGTAVLYTQKVAVSIISRVCVLYVTYYTKMIRIMLVSQLVGAHCACFTGNLLPRRRAWTSLRCVWRGPWLASATCARVSEPCVYIANQNDELNIRWYLRPTRHGCLRTVLSRVVSASRPLFHARLRVRQNSPLRAVQTAKSAWTSLTPLVRWLFFVSSY